MHPNSLEVMKRMTIETGLLLDPSVHVLDVGSLDVNGTYREIFGTCSYTGLDCVEGMNVDKVADAYDLPYKNGEFDLVISGNLLEHLEMPLLAVQEMKRVVKVGGYVLIVAPYSVGEHRYPEDHYRFLPDAFNAFLRGFENVRTGICIPEGGIERHNHSDTWGVGRKPFSPIVERWKVSRMA